LPKNVPSTYIAIKFYSPSTVAAYGGTNGGFYANGEMNHAAKCATFGAFQNHYGGMCPPNEWDSGTLLVHFGRYVAECVHMKSLDLTVFFFKTCFFSD